MPKERGFFYHLSEFFGTVFQYLAAMVLGLLGIAFLATSLYLALTRIGSDFIYYLPFLLVPILFLLLFFSPFAKEENKDDSC